MKTSNDNIKQMITQMITQTRHGGMGHWARKGMRVGTSDMSWEQRSRIPQAG